MTKRRWIATTFGALTGQDWVTITVCLVILVVFVVSIAGLAFRLGNVHK